MLDKSSWIAALKPYGIAVLATGLIVLIRIALAGVLGDDSRMLLLNVAVMIAASYGGWRSGLSATVLGAAMGSYFFLEPVGSILVAGSGAQAHLAVFVVVGLLVSGIGDVFYRDGRRVEDTRSFAFNIVETVRDPLVVLDGDLRIVRVNRSFYQTFQVPPEETEKRLLYELGNGQWNIPKLRTLLEEILPERAEVDDFEVEHDFPGIGRKIMRLNARRIRREGDKATLFLLSIHDVTEREQAERAVRDNSERLRVTLASVGDGIITTDVQGRITYLNIVAETTTGWSDRGATGIPLEQVFRVVDETTREAVESPATRALKDGIHVVSTNRRILIRKDGTEYPVDDRAAPIKDEHGSTCGCVLVFRDISERIRLEHLEREGERLLRFVMDSMPQKVVTAMPDGDVDYFNPQWMEFTGLSFDAIKGSGWKQFIHPEDLTETVRVWQESIDTGRTFLFEHRFRRADGEFRWHLSRVTAMRDADGKIKMWVGSNTEIHEQRQTANQLRQFAADLSEADRRKNEFLAMLAHELRNPLAPIRNAVQVLKLSGGTGEAVTSVSDMMERQVTQMVRLVDDLLDVSRITRGKIELRNSRVDVLSAVNQAVEAADTLMQLMHHRLKISVPERPLYVNADPTRLAQVFGNLLNNACKFTDQGGLISLTVEQEEELVAIRVKDSGIGIAPDQLPKIFDMFMQIDTSLERSVNGLGIGLTLVKNLAEMHGGTAEVFSAGIGRGSEFVVRLPLLVDEPVDRPSMPIVAEPKPSLSPRRILIVDDNRDSALSLAMLLKLGGNTTCTAFDGLEAVEVAAKFHPDVVLLDIGLPKLNGYEAAQKIRAQPRGKEMALVALTGWGQEDDRKRSADAGFDAHAVKPIEYVALMKLLSEIDKSAR